MLNPNQLRTEITGLVSGQDQPQKAKVASVCRRVYEEDLWMRDRPCLWDYSDEFAVMPPLQREYQDYAAPPPHKYGGSLAALKEQRLDGAVRRISRLLQNLQRAVFLSLDRHLREGAETRWRHLDWEAGVQNSLFLFHEKLGPPLRLSQLELKNGEPPNAQTVKASLLTIRLFIMNNMGRRDRQHEALNEMEHAAAVHESMRRGLCQDPSDALAKEEAQVSLRRAMDTLELDDRTIIELHLDGLSHEKIASRLNISSTAAKTRFWRAKRLSGNCSLP